MLAAKLRTMKIAAYMLSCPDRDEMRKRTLANLARTDWNEPAIVEIDRTNHERRQDRQSETALRLLEHAIANGPEVFLFLEDDLDFNLHLRHNLESWYPLRHLAPGGHFFGALYNPKIRHVDRDDALNFFVADPIAVYGSQAFVVSAATARHIVSNWNTQIGMQDIKMSRLASKRTSIYYHQPSLVQHIGVQSAWGGPYHQAIDFQQDWKAGPTAPRVSCGMIVAEMRRVEGWLDDSEARLLIESVVSAANASPDCSIVEVGSYCGKSTVVLGLTLKQLEKSRARVYAVDPHDGMISTLDGSVAPSHPTLEHFRANIAAAGVTSLVEPIVAHSHEVSWTREIDLLFVDGLHDYAHVSADFSHFAPFVKPRGAVAFHDCAPHFPGVKKLVKELIQSGRYQQISEANSLAVLRKVA